MLLMTLVVVFLQLMIAGVIGIFSKETAKAFSDNSTTIFLVFAVGTGLGYYGLCYAAYLKLMEIWRSRVVCLRCGSVWET